MLEKSLTGILQQLYDKLEATVTAIVWVRNNGMAWMMRGKLRHHMNLVPLLLTCGHSSHLVIVLAVHNNYIVKPAQVVTTYLTCSCREIIAMVGTVAAHASVWQFTDMPWSYACGIYLKQL